MNFCDYTPRPEVDFVSLKPNRKRQIKPNGNCFFRCIAFFVRGCECFHSQIREILCELSESNKAAFEPYFFPPRENPTIKYMHQSGFWVTNVEIQAAATALNTIIWVYRDTKSPLVETKSGKWNKYNPIPDIKSFNCEFTEKRILISLIHDHFEPVHSVTRDWLDQRLIRQTECAALHERPLMLFVTRRVGVSAVNLWLGKCELGKCVWGTYAVWAFSYF